MKYNTKILLKLKVSICQTIIIQYVKSHKGEIDKSSSLLKYTIASHPGVEFENIVNLSLKYTCIKFTNKIQPSNVFLS